MTIRTRMAVIVILLMIGWVFAAPHYRSTVSKETNDANTSTPTLQIQRTPPQSHLEVTDVTASSTDAFFYQDEDSQAANQARFSLGPDQLAAIPALALPPPIEPEPEVIAMKPASAEEPVTPRNTLKPVSLVGTNIGSNAEWTTHSPNAAANQNRVSPDRRMVSPDRRIDGGTNQAASFERPPMAVPPSRPFESRTASPPPKSTSLEPLDEPVQRQKGRRWHRIINGDTLSGLSTMYYGSPVHERLIFDANRQSLSSPMILPIGQELIIPDLPNSRPMADRNVQQLTPLGSDGSQGWRTPIPRNH